MNAKQFQELLKQSKAIIKEEPTPDEDWAPKGGPEIMKQRVSQEDGVVPDIISPLDEIIADAEEIISEAEKCKALVERDDPKYEAVAENLIHTIGETTGNLTWNASVIEDEIADSKESQDEEEDDEDEDDEFEEEDR